MVASATVRLLRSAKFLFRSMFSDSIPHGFVAETVKPGLFG